MPESASGIKARTALEKLPLHLWLFFFLAFPFIWHVDFLEAHSPRKGFFLILLGLHLAIRALANVKPINFNPRPMDYLLIVFVLIRVLSSGILTLDSINLVLCLESLMWEFSLLLFYLLLRTEAPGLAWLKRSSIYLLISLTICSLLQLSHIPFLREMTDGRLNANLFHPNVLGLFAVALGAVIFHQKASSFQNKASAICAIFLVLGSASRNALFWLLCALFFLRPLQRRWLILLVLIVPSWQFLRMAKHPAEEYRSRIIEHFTIRSEVFKSSLNGILKQPLGVGPGQFSSKIHPHVNLALHSFFPNPLNQSLQKAHNLILETTFESGWIMFLWWLFAIYFFSKLKPSPPKTAALLLGLGSMLSVILNYPDGQILFIFLIAGAVTEDRFYIRGSIPLREELS